MSAKSQSDKPQGVPLNALLAQFTKRKSTTKPKIPVSYRRAAK